MKINAIRTGSVRIKESQVRGCGHGARRRLNVFVDREWTEPLPIYAWVIEHAEGVIVVDTGETSRVSDPGFLGLVLGAVLGAAQRSRGLEGWRVAPDVPALRPSLTKVPR